MPSEPSERLLDLIYGAVADPALWPAAISAVAELCECEGGVLFGHSIREGAAASEYDGRMDERCDAACQARHLALLRKVVPHLQRALRLAHRLDGYQALQAARQDALERLASGVALLDRQGGVLYANGAAQGLFGAARGLAVQGGTLGCTEPARQRRLDALRQAVLAGQPAASMSLADAGGGLLTLVLSSVHGPDRDRFAAFGAADPALMLFIADSQAALTLPVERLQAAFGLSAAEARVALAACEGGTVARIADGLRLSPNTVKTHLSHVFAKMGVGRRAQLVQLLQAVAQVDARPRGPRGPADDQSPITGQSPVQVSDFMNSTGTPLRVRSSAWNTITSPLAESISTDAPPGAP